MKKKKIVFVLPVQSPYVTLRLESLATDTELDVVLLLEEASMGHRPGWRPQPISNVTVEVLGGALFPRLVKHRDLGYAIAGIRSMPWRLPFALWCHRPDVVVVCNATQLFVALPLRWLLGYRLGLNVEDTPHATRNLGRWNRRVKAWCYRRADFWLPFSAMAEQFLVSIGVEERCYRTSWSLDMAALAPRREAREQVRENLSVGERMLFLFAGALIPGKGVMPLLRSWAQLPDGLRKQAMLVLVGSGSQKQEAQHYAEATGLVEVVFLGQVPYADMQDYYSAADIFVLPTFQDLYSLVVVEAMACGCPVLTTLYNGASELVEDGVTGWLFDVSNPCAIREVLEQAIAKRLDLPEMGKKARQRVSDMDNVEVMRQLGRVLKRVAKQDEKDV